MPDDLAIFPPLSIGNSWWYEHNIMEAASDERRETWVGGGWMVESLSSHEELIHIQIYGREQTIALGYGQLKMTCCAPIPVMCPSDRTVVCSFLLLDIFFIACQSMNQLSLGLRKSQLGTCRHRRWEIRDDGCK